MANIEGPRLAGDIGRREMLIEERVQILASILGHDTAGAVVEEAINHHPIEPRQIAKLEGCLLSHRAVRLDRQPETGRSFGEVI